MKEEIMDIEEMKMVLSVVDEQVQIWVESVGGGAIPITNYDFDLNNNRIILRLAE